MSELDALQTALAGEHAAVHVYGALGGRTSASATPALFEAVSAAYTAHRARRDLLTAAVIDAEGEPVAAAPAYEVPRLESPRDVERAARELERSCAATYAYLVASTAGAPRRLAIGALNDAAVRELAFRGTPETFPGLDEYTDR
ncbi:DUF4439 domain-containing protein [Nocardioides caricicola]|uniref:DUF4439 domain-containing protein n=1 Tax=Nocardioides caricicola TaxID=634770 RepID=A0ABW0N0D0_9ACTN